MSYIKVNIDESRNQISIKNNGRGIPVEIHKDHGIYVPELIFGNLLTSSNYNDNIRKVTGGRNGYGAKLTNIFSKKFIVETADKKQKKLYKQTFTQNMLSKSKPEIKEYHKEDYTCITFEPDLQKFNMEKLDEDIIALFKKRVYDIAGITPKSVSVYLNDVKLNVKNFSSYIDMYLSSMKEDEDEEEPIKVFESPNERWEIGMSLSESQFQQVSYVNSICTSKGGTHVTYATDKIVNAILVELQKKNKSLTIKPQHVKQHLFIFVNCLIENPAFDSQTKETLSSKRDTFGSTFELSDSFLKHVIKSGIVERCLRYAKTREEEKCLKKLNGKNKKTARLIGIEKLEDANKAGTKDSDRCTLILTEGDSAKALAMAGIEMVGQDYYGCFPLRGKMLNVRDAKSKTIANNTEVQNLMKILGIRVGEAYTDVKNLRYGSILIMTDQDVDGSHIKGLIINFIHHFWPSLIKINGFMKEFITPIIKATKGRETLSFYTLPEYKRWVESHNNRVKGWKIKYYKGLGTSTNKEAQEYFGELERNKIEFQYTNDKDDERIDLAFNKKKTEERKKWLNDFDQNSEPLSSTIKKLSYQDFVDKELVLFSIYDNQRSIPSICDGLKPSERKILYGCFKRNLKEEIKVAQLVGYIGEHSAYHHGEQSLSGTIVAMAQNFVGSNNINLLLPIGQFGSRAMGGKDSASARYIFTNLNKVTRQLFNVNDLPLMNYLIEEGQKIEPTWYLPIIPLVLVNGTEGIGTGWSTEIPCFNPHDIVNSIKNKITKGKFTEIYPWYKGFTGTIEKKEDNSSFYVNGKYYWDENDILHITEIPLQKWTKDYKNMLEEYMGYEIKKDSEHKQKGKKGNKKVKSSNNDDNAKEKKKKIVIVEDVRQNHSSNRIHFEVKLLPDFVEEYKSSHEKVMKTFKLQSSLSLRNMVLFSHEGKIKKYPSVESILEEFYTLRLEFYDKRKKYMMSILKRDLAILENKVRFIRAVVNEDIVIRKVKRNDLIKLLLKEKFDPMSKLENLRIKTASEKAAEVEVIDKTQEQGEAEETELESSSESNKPPVPAKEFDYLLSLPLWSLTYERVIELENQMKQKEKEYDALSKMELTTMWIDDMDHFIEVLDEYEQKEEEERLMANKIKKGRGTKAEGKAKGGKKKDKGNKKDNKENKQNKPKTQIDNELNDSISINGGEKVNAFDLMKSANKGKDNKPFKVNNKRKDSDVPSADPKHNYQLSKKRKIVENVDDSFDEFIMNYENKSKIL